MARTNADQFSRRSPLRQALGRFSRIGYLRIRLLRLQGRRSGAMTEAVEAVATGAVTIASRDVQLNGEYPKGVRPDLSVDGTIEVERLPDVMYVGRPAYGQADTTVSMFKWLPNGEAVRVQVKLGRTSVNTIEIKEGLQIGDRVILSDMSAWDSYDRLRIN